MTDELNSRHWYRVAPLTPRLHDQVDIHRHDYRGQIWYLVENTTTGRSHRFNPTAYQFIGMMDGERSVQDIYSQINENLDGHAPGQEEIIDLMSKLYEADLLKVNTQTNTEEMFGRQSKQRANKLKQRFANPVAMRFPLWDPEDFLNRNFPRVQWIFSKWVGLMWLLLMVYTVSEAMQHWSQIDHHFGINALSPYNLILLFLLYPPIKFVHELGHAFSAKLEGGEVHEMGVNFLLFVPIPYVNVSAATHFRSRSQAHARQRCGNHGRILPRGDRPAVVSGSATRSGAEHRIQYFSDRGNLVTIFQWQSPAEIRRLLHTRRCARYSEPVPAIWTILAVPVSTLSVRNARCSIAGQRTGRSTLVCRSTAWRRWLTGWEFSGSSLLSSPRNSSFFGMVLAGWMVSLQVIQPAYKALSYLLTSPALQRKRGRALTASCLLAGIVVAVYRFYANTFLYPEPGSCLATRRGAPARRARRICRVPHGQK